MPMKLFALGALLALATATPSAQPPVVNPDADKEDWIVLFNGKDLTGWTPKIAKHELGDNFGNTFRVEDGLLKVRYDKYKTASTGSSDTSSTRTRTPTTAWSSNTASSATRLPGNPGAWAFRNSGAMLHSPDPRTMPRDQDFPISIEAQFLGGNSDGKPRPTVEHVQPRHGGRLPGHYLQGSLPQLHARPPSTATSGCAPRWWCTAPARSSHYANGQKVLEYSMPQYGGGQVANYDATTKIDGKLIEGGYISLQSESHPIDFRKVELLNLAGCMDKAATNYKTLLRQVGAGGLQVRRGREAGDAPARRIPGQRRSAAAGRHSEGPPRRAVRIPQQDHRRHGAALLDLRARAIQRQEAAPANVLVFQDGQRATNPNGSLRVPQVMENLIAKGKMPVTIGIFITPGNLSETYPTDLEMRNPNHRKEEYDALNDTYARFLIEEMLPEVGKKYKLTDDPEKRAIGGTSSGAIAAFTVAWQRPDMFRHVISMIGSYTSIGYSPAADGKPMIAGRRSVSHADPQEPDQAHPHLSAGRREGSVERTRQLVPRQPADAVGVRVRQRQGRP